MIISKKLHLFVLTTDIINLVFFFMHVCLLNLLAEIARYFISISRKITSTLVYLKYK